MINVATVMGYLGQDPELRYTQTQEPVATLSVATTKKWTSKSGEAQEHTEWHRVVVWGKQAENCSKYLTKGRCVHVTGELRTRSWEDKDGQKKYTTEIVAHNVVFVPDGKGKGDRPPHPGDQPGQSTTSSPSGQQNRGGSQQRSNGRSSGPTNENTGSSYGGDYGGPDTPGLDDIPF